MVFREKQAVAAYRGRCFPWIRTKFFRIMGKRESRRKRGKPQVLKNCFSLHNIAVLISSMDQRKEQGSGAEDDEQDQKRAGKPVKIQASLLKAQ